MTADVPALVAASRPLLLALAAVTTVAVILLAGLVLRPRERSATVRTAGPTREAREALELVGNTLAATHDVDALLPVILDAAVGATGAGGGRMLREGIEVARTGDVSVAAPLGLNLHAGEGDHVRLLLYPPKGGFTGEAPELAHWLTVQAGIALENARLHGVAQRQALTDDLTGLANRRRFVAELEAEIARARRFGEGPAIVLADLDNFKQVNDRYGHHFGDEVLRSFADALWRHLRQVDLPARIGGEEFAILLPQTDVDGAAVLARRVAVGVRELRLSREQGDDVTVTASFGVAAYEPGGTVDTLLRAADSALYRAKAGGKDQVALAGAGSPSGSSSESSA